MLQLDGLVLLGTISSFISNRVAWGYTAQSCLQRLLGNTSALSFAQLGTVSNGAVLSSSALHSSTVVSHLIQQVRWTHLPIQGQAGTDELLQQECEPSLLQGVAEALPGCRVHPQSGLKSLQGSSQGLQQPAIPGFARCVHFCRVEVFAPRQFCHASVPAGGSSAVLQGLPVCNLAQTGRLLSLEAPNDRDLFFVVLLQECRYSKIVVKSCRQRMTSALVTKCFCISGDCEQNIPLLL